MSDNPVFTTGPGSTTAGVTTAATAATARRHHRNRSDIEPLLLLVHPRQEHGDGAGSPASPGLSASPFSASPPAEEVGHDEPSRASATTALLGERDERSRQGTGGGGGGEAGGRFVLVLTVSACVSGLLFGC